MTFSVSAPTNNTGALLNNGTEVLSIDSSNNVSVPNDLNLSGTLTHNAGTFDNRGLRLAHQNNINQSYIGAYSGANTGTGTRIRFGYNDGTTSEAASNINFVTNSAERVRIDENGYVTMPNQPVFCVRLGTSISSPTANQDVVFDTIQTNVGSHYSTSTGLFTAPVAGRYRFHSILQFMNGSAQIYTGAGFQQNGTTITS